MTNDNSLSDRHGGIYKGIEDEPAKKLAAYLSFETGFNIVAEETKNLTRDAAAPVPSNESVWRIGAVSKESGDFKTFAEVRVSKTVTSAGQDESPVAIVTISLPNHAEDPKEGSFVLMLGGQKNSDPALQLEQYIDAHKLTAKIEKQAALESGTVSKGDIYERHGGIYKRNQQPAEILAAYLAYKTDLPIVARESGIPKLKKGGKGSLYKAEEESTWQIGYPSHAFLKFKTFATVNARKFHEHEGNISTSFKITPKSPDVIRMTLHFSENPLVDIFNPGAEAHWIGEHPAVQLENYVNSSGLAEQIKKQVATKKGRG